MAQPRYRKVKFPLQFPIKNQFASNRPFRPVDLKLFSNSSVDKKDLSVEKNAGFVRTVNFKKPVAKLNKSETVFSSEHQGRRLGPGRNFKKRGNN